MEWILLVGIIFLIASMAEGPSKASKRTKRLDPGSPNDFGGKL